MRCLVLVSVVVLVAPWLTAQNASFSFSGENTSVVFTEGRERTVLSGNARVVSKSTELRADRIEVYGEGFRFAECIGNVVVYDRESQYRLKTNQLFFDRELEIVRGEGQAVMEDFNNEIVIKGEYLEHRNLENRSELQIGVRILGQDLNARAEILRYERTSQLLELIGLPFVIWKNNRYQGARITVDLDDDIVNIQGKVFGSIDVEEQEVTSDQAYIPADILGDATSEILGDATADTLDTTSDRADIPADIPNETTSTTPNTPDSVIPAAPVPDAVPDLVPRFPRVNADATNDVTGDATTDIPAAPVPDATTDITDATPAQETDTTADTPDTTSDSVPSFPRVNADATNDVTGDATTDIPDATSDSVLRFPRVNADATNDVTSDTTTDILDSTTPTLVPDTTPDSLLVPNVNVDVTSDVSVLDTPRTPSHAPIYLNTRLSQ